MSKEFDHEEYRESIEHRDALLNVRAILSTKAGLEFFKYLFQNYDVGTLPEQGLEGSLLHERMGMLRAGNAIFELLCEANADIAASLLAQVRKDQYARLQAEYSERKDR